MRLLLTALTLVLQIGCGDSIGPVGMYGPCDLAAECVAAADLCKPIELGAGPVFNIGGVCTIECTASDQCPEGGVCSRVPGGDVAPVTCQKRCEIDDDCAFNYACVRRATEDEGVVSMCMPQCTTGGLPRC